MNSADLPALRSNVTVSVIGEAAPPLTEYVPANVVPEGTVNVTWIPNAKSGAASDPSALTTVFSTVSEPVGTGAGAV